MSEIISQARTLILDDGHKVNYTLLRPQGSQKPLLVFIVGSSGLGAFFHRLAVQLSVDFTCVYYDRRGFDSSEGDPTEEHVQPPIVARHAKDAAALITHLTGTQTHRNEQRGAFIFGTSFGATIALCLVLAYPDLIHKAIIHEPMLPNLLPEGQERDRAVHGFYDVYSADAPFSIFAERFLSIKQSSDSDGTIARTGRGESFWKQGSVRNLQQARRESLAATEYYPEVNKLADVSDKLLLAAGAESRKLPLYSMLRALAGTVSLQEDILDIDGGHFTYVSRENVGSLSLKVKRVFQDSLGTAHETAKM